MNDKKIDENIITAARLAVLILFTPGGWVCLGFTALWVYLMYINFSYFDLVVQPLAIWLGIRAAKYGAWGFLPFGKWLHERHYATVCYFSVFTIWKYKLSFFIENLFKLDFHYLKKETAKGDSSSLREVTTPVAVTVGLGFWDLIFVLDKSQLKN